MKKLTLLFSILVLVFSCTSQKNSEEFIEQITGRYLFNANEVIEIFFIDGEMHAKWRGNDDIELLKVSDSSFYMRALNEKMVFVSEPEMQIKLEEKTEHEGVKYVFKKLKKGEKTPSEYFESKEYDKALEAFKSIKERDSLNPVIREYKINRLGYNYLRNKEYEKAEQMFLINISLYPKSSNVYDSMGDLFYRKNDTVNAIEYYKKALSINPENRSSKRQLEKLSKK